MKTTAGRWRPDQEPIVCRRIIGGVGWLPASTLMYRTFRRALLRRHRVGRSSRKWIGLLLQLRQSRSRRRIDLRASHAAVWKHGPGLLWRPLHHLSGQRSRAVHSRPRHRSLGERCACTRYDAVRRGAGVVAIVQPSERVSRRAASLRGSHIVVGPVLSNCDTAVTSCAGANGFCSKMLLGTPCEGHWSAAAPVM